MSEKLACQICGREFGSYSGLSIHTRCTHKILSKEYYDLYLKKENEGVCLECGKETSFKNINKGYYLHCSIKCRSNSFELKEKARQTNLERYGVTNSLHSEEIKEKVKQTNLERYGVEYYLQSNEAKKNNSFRMLNGVVTCKLFHSKSL